MQGIWLNGEKKDTIILTEFEHSLKNKGSEEWEEIGGWGKSADWCPPELLNNQKREVCLELLDVYWVGQVIMRLIGMSQEDIKEVQEADMDGVSESQAKDRKNRVFEKYLPDYKFIIQNLLVNILERDKFRHTFRDLKIYLDKIKPLYHDVKLNFNPEVDKIAQQTLQQKLERIEFYQPFEQIQKEIKYLKSIGKFNYFILKQYSKASQYFEKVQKLEEEFYGVGAQQLIKIYKLLVCVYIKLGMENNVKALSLLDQLQQIDYSQSTLEFILRKKSKISYKLGNFDESIQYFSELLQNIQSINGEGSIQYLEWEIKLGTLYRKMRNLDFSVEMHQQCLESFIEKLSENQQDQTIECLIKKCKYQLMQDYIEFDDFIKTDSLLDEMMQNYENFQLINCQQFLHLVNLKAFVSSELDKLYQGEQALLILEKNTQTALKCYGAESAIISETYYYLGLEYLKQNNIQKAADFANKSIKISLKIFPEHKIAIINCFILCATLELKQNSTQKAVALAQKALKSCQIIFATNSKLACKILQLLGDTYKASNNYLKAQEYLEQALEILKIISPSQKFSAEIYLSLNLTLNALHDYERSKNQGLHSIKMFFQNQDELSELKAKTIECLAEAMLHTGDQENGLKYYEQILEYKSQKLKEGNSIQQDEIIKIYILLGSFLNKSKNKANIEKSVAYFQNVIFILSLQLNYKALKIQIEAKSENSQEVLAVLQLFLLAYQNTNNKKKIKEIKSRIDKIKSHFLKQHC